MLDKRDLEYKEYIKLQKEMNSLYKELRKLPLVELKEPYQRGWEIYYDLRDDIKRRADGYLILQAVKLGYNNGYTRQPSHVKNVRRNFPVKHPINPGKVKLKINQIPEHLRKYFILDEYPKRETDTRYYILEIPRYWLVRRVRPNMITHIRDTSHIDARMSQIRNEMSNTKFAKYYRRSYGYHYPAEKERTYMRTELGKVVKGEAEDVFHKGIPKEFDW